MLYTRSCVYSRMKRGAKGMYTRSEAGKLGYAKTQDKLKQHREDIRVATKNAYDANLPRCAFCACVLPYEKRRYKFCNRSCAASYNNQGVVRNPRKVERRTHCLRCNRPFKGAGILYCTQECSHLHRQELFAENLVNGTKPLAAGSIPAIRRCLIRLRGEQCEECGWSKRHSDTGRVPIEVHHVDGNFENNRVENVRLLCPNCHSLTPTFRNLNKGNGRAYRRNAPE